MSNQTWRVELAEFYKSGIGHAFIAHFNVNDYFSWDRGITVKESIIELFSSFDIVMSYQRSEGLTFANKSSEVKAIEIVASNPSQDQNDLLSFDNSSSQEFEFPDYPSQLFPLLTEILNSTVYKSLLIIEDGEYICPSMDLSTLSPDDRLILSTLTNWGKIRKLNNNNNVVVIIAKNIGDISPTLMDSRYIPIKIDLPSEMDRRKFIATNIKKREIQLEKDLTLDKLVNATSGLNLLSIEDILLRSIGQELTLKMVWSRKREIFSSSYSDVLDVVEPKYSFDQIGGMDLAKDFLTRNVVKPMLAGNTKRVPMGILLCGPSGTGKTVLVNSLAFESGINFVILRIGGQISSKYVGESERNLSRALSAIKSFVPTILFIDELDQVMGGRGGINENSSDKRLFQMLLEFLSDVTLRGRVLFIAATNRPDLLDAALKRSGRIDKKIPILIPDRDDREKIFQVMCKRYFDNCQEFEISPEVLDQTEGLTGAEIETITVKAYELVEDYDLSIGEAISRASNSIKPSTKQIEYMTRLAIQEASDIDLVPEKYRYLLEDRSKLDKEIKSEEFSEFREGRSL